MSARFRKVLVFLVFVIAWDANQAVSAPHNNPDERAAVASKAVDGDFDFFYVPAEGLISDTTFITVSKAKGPSKMAVALGNAMVVADVSHKPIAVSGASDAKTEQVVIDALVSTGRDLLPGLHLVYVGGEAAGNRLKEIAAGYGAQFTFVKF
jgi:hypothetical protein